MILAGFIPAEGSFVNIRDVELERHGNYLKVFTKSTIYETDYISKISRKHRSHR